MCLQPSAVGVQLFLHTCLAVFRHPCCRGNSVPLRSGFCVWGLPNFVLEGTVWTCYEAMIWRGCLIFLIFLRYNLKFGLTPSCFSRTLYGAKLCLCSEQPCRIWKGTLFFASHCLIIYVVCLRVLCVVGMYFQKSCIEGSTVLEMCKNLCRFWYSLEKMSRARKWFWFWPYPVIQTAQFP